MHSKRCNRCRKEPPGKHLGSTCCRWDIAAGALLSEPAQFFPGAHARQFLSQGQAKFATPTPSFFSLPRPLGVFVVSFLQEWVIVLLRLRLLLGFLTRLAIFRPLFPHTHQHLRVNWLFFREAFFAHFELPIGFSCDKRRRRATNSRVT